MLMPPDSWRSDSLPFTKKFWLLLLLREEFVFRIIIFVATCTSDNFPRYLRISMWDMGSIEVSISWNINAE